MTFSLVYATDARGRQPGREFVESLRHDERAKIDRVLSRISSGQRLTNTEQWKRLGGHAGAAGFLWEAKARQARVICAIRDRSILILDGVVKKGGMFSPDRALRILREHDATCPTA